MLKTCIICKEDFDLTPMHKGFANRCESCQRPKPVTKENRLAADLKRAELARKLAKEEADYRFAEAVRKEEIEKSRRALMTQEQRDAEDAANKKRAQQRAQWRQDSLMIILQLIEKAGRRSSLEY